MPPEHPRSSPGAPNACNRAPAPSKRRPGTSKSSLRRPPGPHFGASGSENASFLVFFLDIPERKFPGGGGESPQASSINYITLHYITLHTYIHLKRQERKASLRRRVVACAAVRLCARVGTLRDTRRPFFDLTMFARTPSVKHRMLEARWWSWSGNLSSFLWPNGLPDLHFEV